MNPGVIGGLTRPETLRYILKHSWPVLVSQWASMSFGVLDTVMNGHASPTDLAAMALAVTVYITVYVGLMGVMHALFKPGRPSISTTQIPHCPPGGRSG